MSVKDKSEEWMDEIGTIFMYLYVYIYVWCENVVMW